MHQCIFVFVSPSFSATEPHCSLVSFGGCQTYFKRFVLKLYSRKKKNSHLVLFWNIHICQQLTQQMIKKPPNPLSKLHKVVRHMKGCPIATQPHLIFYIKKTPIGKTRKTKVYETLKTCSNFLANSLQKKSNPWLWKSIICNSRGKEHVKRVEFYPYSSSFLGLNS